MTEEGTNARHLGDGPAEDDQLDFKPYTDSIVDTIRETPGPMVIGVYGSWGSGKTSLMHFVRKGLGPKGAGGGETIFRSAWFDAWKYDKEEALWRALLLRVIDSLRDWEDDEDKTDDDLLQDIERLEQRLYRDVEWEEKGGLTVDWPELGKDAAKGAVRLAFSFLPGFNTLEEAAKAAQGKLGEGEDAKDLLSAFRRDVVSHHQAQLRSLEQFQIEFGELVKKHIVTKGQRLVVFVDDLDRCAPTKSVEVLEAIKLFLDVEGCIFVLGLDHDVVTHGIEVKYRDYVIQDLDGEETRQRLLVKGAAYLEKIIQLPFRLPPIQQDAMQVYVRSLATFDDDRCVEVFGIGLETNPRKVKRAVSIFQFLRRLADHRNQDLQKKGKKPLNISPVRLAKIVVIYQSHTELYRLLEKNPARLRDLERHILSSAVEKPDVDADAKKRSGDTHRTELDRFLTPELRKVLGLFSDHKDACFSDIELDELNSYFTLTRGTMISETESVAGQRGSINLPFSVPELIPIPSGTFQMGTSDAEIEFLVKTTDWASERMKNDWFKSEQPKHEVSLNQFHMGKYPITNAEYEAFVRTGNDFAVPIQWPGNSCPSSLVAHPVVNVNWEEATAYCLWLTQEARKAKQITKQEEFRLPTEAEWEFAARGKEGRIWPWGETWEANRCNNSENRVGQTTPVGHFSPEGDSVYGNSDMVGNVWEWCQDWYGKYEPNSVTDPTGPKNELRRVLRGGSWGNAAEYCRSAYRRYNRPSTRNVNFGFRVVLARSSDQDTEEHMAEGR